MPNTVHCEFTVEGHGRFPVDMLRYDCCFPLSGDDAENIIAHSAEESEHSLRKVRLVSNTLWRPTVDRWSSFGWVVLAQGENWDYRPVVA